MTSHWNAVNKTFIYDLQRELKSRGLYDGMLDSRAGAQTREGLQRLLQSYKLTQETLPSNSSSNGSKLYAHAYKDYGLKETAGSASTPRIKRAILEAASWLNPDDSVTAWCGCIMGLWCSEVGLGVPSEYYRAINWLNVGKSVTLANAHQGDIVVLSRTGGNHVALYHSHTTSQIRLLGGNQSNAVNLTNYSLSNLKGIRRV